jgi:hypothetical protein
MIFKEMIFIIKKMFTSFNIVEFIEKNPLTKLNNTYQNIFINKIKKDFNEEEQSLFVTSFYCYLNFNPITDFIIDFEDVWKWCGFTRKDNAKRLLEKFFKEEIDYKIVFLRSEEKSNIGRPKEKITLNIKTFKKFCLKSDTEKADQIHNYYIKLEEILQEVILQQTDELKLQLEKSKHEVKKLTRKYVKNPKVIIDEKNVVYLMCTAESEKEGEYIIGKATSLSDRKENYDHNKLHDFKVVYFRNCNSSKLMDIIESAVLMKLGKYRCKAGRDVFLLPESKDISLFTNVFDECVIFFEDVDDDCIIYPKKTVLKMDKDVAKEKNNKYQTENKEKIKESIKEYYNDNKDVLKEIHKVYYEKNIDIIAEKHKKYYEENKDKVIEKCMEYYEENKEQILEDRKNFYENNKEQILKERSDYYKENYKLKIAPQRQKKENCECGMVIAHVSMKNHKKSARHQLMMEKLNSNSKINF